MFVVLRMITFPDGAAEGRDDTAASLLEAGGRLPGVTASWAAPVAQVATINAGDVVWRTTFRSESEALHAPLTPAWEQTIAPLLAGSQLTTVGYRVGHRGGGADAPGIWRGLMLRVLPAGFPGPVGQLERELLLFPGYISSIRAWALSAVSFVEGPKAFTHVWEQEYDDVSGLTGEYMAHPLHWGLTDRFFDSESPDFIVDPYLVQVVGAIDGSVLAPVPAQ